MIPTDFAPHELIKASYSDVERCVSSLVEIAKVNNDLIQEVIELAIVIGINAAHRRMERDRIAAAIQPIKDQMTWSGFQK